MDAESIEVLRREFSMAIALTIEKAKEAQEKEKEKGKEKGKETTEGTHSPATISTSVMRREEEWGYKEGEKKIGKKRETTPSQSF